MEPMLDSYNDNSALQATCQTVGNPMLARMASTYGAGKLKEALQVVRMAEYGCSGGRNSYAPLHTMISALRSQSPALRAECVLEDLPSNTWHQVMEEAPRLTAAFEGRVQVLCAGTSFYNQVCGDASLDLAYSYVSAHFLSNSMPLVSHVLMHESAPGERTAWEAQAARDWENFLLLRARELKKGAKIITREARGRGAVYPCVFAIRSGDHGAVRVEIPGGLFVCGRLVAVLAYRDGRREQPACERPGFARSQARGGGVGRNVLDAARSTWPKRHIVEGGDGGGLGSV